MAARSSYAADVNEGGQVVGSLGITSVTDHAFSWTQKGGAVDLGTLGGANSYAVAVNDGGQIVGGSSTTGDLSTHAVVWQR